MPTRMFDESTYYDKGYGRPPRLPVPSEVAGSQPQTEDGGQVNPTPRNNKVVKQDLVGKY